MPEFIELGLSPNFVGYEEAWEIQRKIHAEVAAGTRGNTVLLLEHQPVYTAGKRTEGVEYPQDGTPVIETDRGGKITWHGPGQLVGYPIVKLSEPMDVVAYVRTIEGLLMDCLNNFGVTGERVEGRSGVWIKRGLTHDKIAAIGIRISEGVSTHGFALNCNNSLEAYKNIIACGITDAGSTTLSQVTGENICPKDLVPIVSEKFISYFEDAHVS